MFPEPCEGERAAIAQADIIWLLARTFLMPFVKPIHEDETAVLAVLDGCVNPRG
jgi:hypothetical protein